MLPSHSDNIRAPLSRVQQECKREARPCAYLETSLKAADVIFGPGRESTATDFQLLEPSARIIRSESLVDREPHKHTKGTQGLVRRPWPVGPSSHYSFDVFPPDQSHGFASVVLTKTFNLGAIRGLRNRSKRPEVARGVVRGD
jgi:hypothetical protein